MAHPFVTLNPARFRRYTTHGTLEELHSGFRWTEGPVWFADSQCLLFSDIPSNKILRWVEGQGVSVYRSPSNKANGLTRDRRGRLIVCEHGARRVTRTELDGRISILADRFEGARLNSPNDVVVMSDESVWFTDPDYGILSDYTGLRGEREISSCNVFRIDPITSEISAAATDLQKPNGLAFSPDERTLYVADSGVSHDPDGPHHIIAYDVAGSTLKNPRVFAEIEGGAPDGFRVDEEGNLWVCTVYAGVAIFGPDGECIGRIDIPGAVNLAFGGEQLNRLFVTAGPKLFSLFTGTRGTSTV